MNNISLIGMAGSGKTTVGTILAEELNYNFIDIDTEIEKQENISINEIFALKGEKYFRKVESNIIKSTLSKVKNTVISLGGGAFISDDNKQIILQHSITLWLSCEAKELFNRLKNDTTRPLLKDISLKKIKTIEESRKTCYNKANFTIETTNKDINLIIENIKKCLK